MDDSRVPRPSQRSLAPRTFLNVQRPTSRVEPEFRSRGARASGVRWPASRQSVVPLTFSVSPRRTKLAVAPERVNTERDFGGTPKSTRGTRVLPDYCFGIRVESSPLPRVRYSFAFTAFFSAGFGVPAAALDFLSRN